MGRVFVGELGFDSLKEAQDYAKELKKDPNYVPPVKTAQEFFDSIPPMTEEQLADHKAGEKQAGEELEQGLAMEMDEAAPGQDKTVETVVESNTVVVETGLEFETKEVEPEFMPDNYEDMTDKQKESYDADLAQAAYESSSPEEQEAIDAEIEDFEQDILDEAANAESDN